LDPELAFQDLDLYAERRLRDIQGVRRLGYAAQLADPHEALKLPTAHAASLPSGDR
jgi:hypothetical protein